MLFTASLVNKFHFKVLHGGIDCSFFNKMPNYVKTQPKILSNYSASDGEYMWMNKNW